MPRIHFALEFAAPLSTFHTSAIMTWGDPYSRAQGNATTPTLKPSATRNPNQNM